MPKERIAKNKFGTGLKTRAIKRKKNNTQSARTSLDKETKSSLRQKSKQNKPKRHVLTQYLLSRTEIKLKPIQNYATEDVNQAKPEKPHRAHRKYTTKPPGGGGTQQMLG